MIIAYFKYNKLYDLFTSQDIFNHMCSTLITNDFQKNLLENCGWCCTEWYDKNSFVIFISDFNKVYSGVGFSSPGTYIGGNIGLKIWDLADTIKMKLREEKLKRLVK